MYLLCKQVMYISNDIIMSLFKACRSCVYTSCNPMSIQLMRMHYLDKVICDLPVFGFTPNKYS